MQDWKDTLSQVAATQKSKAKRHRQDRTAQLRRVTSNWKQVHPRDMLLKLNPLFNAVAHKHVGGWPDESTPEATPEQIMEFAGDLIKVVLVRNNTVFMRTNRGYFKFYNK